MADGKVVFEITGDNSSLKKTLNDTTQQISTEGKKWDKSVDDSSGNISTSLIGAFKAVTASAAFVKISQMLIQLGAESIDLASDLEEVQNVVDVTFGAEGSKKVEKWAAQAGSQFGLTELQAKRYASTLGAMMKSSGMTEDQIYDMSVGLAGLAADMASFYNLDFDTAFTKIQSGMAGMSMPLRQLGIDMTETSVAAFAAAQGFDTEFSKMSEAEQMIVRYQYLMQATADAQGDFARTSSSYANSQRRIATGVDTLKAQLGEALLPIVSTVSDAIADLLEVLTYTPPETALDVANNSIAEAAGNATQAQGILGYMDKLYEKYGDAAAKSNEWAQALERLKEVFPEVNQFIDAETGALTASNEQLREYIENSKQAAIEDAKRNAVQTLNEQYVQAGMDYYTQEINRDIANEQATAAVESLIDYVVEGLTRRGLGEDEETAYLTDREEWIKGFQNGNIGMDFLMQQARQVADENGDSRKTVEEYQRIYNEQSKAATDASNKMKELSNKMFQLETDLAIANAALARLSASADTASAALAGVNGTGEASDGSHAGGLDYVPWDGYRAILHKGERVQTAAEASLMRGFGNYQPGLDYAALGGVMRDNVHAGGNVYLDGRTVGSVISDAQGQSYRALQRSGWQQ